MAHAAGILLAPVFLTISGQPSLSAGHSCHSRGSPIAAALRMALRLRSLESPDPAPLAVHTAQSLRDDLDAADAVRRPGLCARVEAQLILRTLKSGRIVVDLRPAPLKKG